MHCLRSVVAGARRRAMLAPAGAALINNRCAVSAHQLVIISQQRRWNTTNGAASPTADASDKKNPTTTSSATGGGEGGSSSSNATLWEDCDTLEDILDEEKFGSRADIEREGRIAAYKDALRRKIAAKEAEIAAARSSNVDEPQTAGTDDLKAAPTDDATTTTPGADEEAMPELSEEDRAAEAQREAEAADAARVASEMKGKLPFEIPEDVSPEDHHAIAKRALWIGTLVAFALSAVCIIIGMAAMGFTSVSEMLEYVGSRDERAIARLREEGEDVTVIKLDLSDPEALAQQVSQVVEIVKREAVTTSDDDDHEE